MHHFKPDIYLLNRLIHPQRLNELLLSWLILVHNLTFAINNLYRILSKITSFSGLGSSSLILAMLANLPQFVKDILSVQKLLTTLLSSAHTI